MPSNQTKATQYKVKLVTLVPGDTKVPFSNAITPRCRGGCHSIPWIAPLYSWSLPYSAESWARQHHVPFLCLWYDSTWHWTAVSWTIGEHEYIYIYCHPQTNCFVLSELFSVARHAGRSIPGSKPVRLYVRLSLSIYIYIYIPLQKRFS